MITGIYWGLEWSFCEVISKQLSNLGVLFLDLLLWNLFSSVILADEEVESNNLTLLLNIYHFVAELRDAVEVEIRVCYVFIDKFAVSDDIEKFLQDLSDEVKKNATAIAWNFLL